jgi:hypothetical protein
MYSEDEGSRCEISSSLIESIRGNGDSGVEYSRLFVLAGFCLVAAVSSRAFIRSISERLLQDVRTAKKSAEQAEKDAGVEVIVLPGPTDAEQLTITYSKWNGNGHHFYITGPAVRKPIENIHTFRS